MKSYRENRTGILHIFSGDLWAGAEVMIFHLLTRLHAGSDIKIMALSLNEGMLSDKLREAGVETFVIPESGNSFFEIVMKAWAALRGRRIDVIHSHRYKENLLAFILGQLAGVNRLVTTLHGLSETPACAKKGTIPISLKQRLDYFLLKHAFIRVVTVSQDMQQILVNRYGFAKGRVKVIHNGIEVPRLPGLRDKGSENQHFHIGTVGRMLPVKDFELFLEVAAEIKSQADNVYFSLLGEGPLKAQLIQKSQELKLEGSVRFQSPLSDTFPYYQSLDLYVNTSLYEGMPLSILEAMACGKPVVAPRVGGIPEVILDGVHGFLTDRRDPKEFASLCMKLIGNENLRRVIGQNALSRVQWGFTSCQMAASYRTLYQAL